jgi:peptide/nickel transport system substrate-binding protein
MTIGVGIAPGQSELAGIPSTVRNIALEGLVSFGLDGRAQPRLAESWEASPEGLVLKIRLRRDAKFHDGESVSAAAVRDILIRLLPDAMGPAFSDLREIQAVGNELTFVLNRRSRFLFESLDQTLQKAGDPPIGTGPFRAVDPIKGKDEVEMLANEDYYAGKPLIDRLIIRRYQTVRGAWADMLRGQVDMLYDVGIDNLDSLQPSRRTKVFTFQRPYAYVVILNAKRPKLQDARVRRALNYAVDRQALIAVGFQGHATPADGPVWPFHWAYDAESPRFRYDPKPLNAPLRFTCLFVEPSHERLGLVLQRQLQEIGVEMTLQELPVDEVGDRVAKQDFDAILVDVGAAPTLHRAFLFWYSGSPYNYAKSSSNRIDAALDGIRRSADDTEYRQMVGAFQQAMIDDPPAIFLAWSERARAVSTRFSVEAEPGQDILRTLRLWRPAADKPVESSN